MGRRYPFERLMNIALSLCSETPQDVADTGAVGDSEQASRCNHKHRGVAQLVAGPNITLNPAAGRGAVTISAAGGGGGMSSNRVTYTGDGAADHWVDLGVAPKMVYFFRLGSWTERLWLFNGSTGICAGYALESEHAGLANGTLINVGLNGLANEEWGDWWLNEAGRQWVAYVFS